MSDPTHSQAPEPGNAGPRADEREVEKSGDKSDGKSGERGVNRVRDEDAPRIVPERGGMDESDMREHDLATHPDKIEDNPDGAGDRPRPL